MQDQAFAKLMVAGLLELFPQPEDSLGTGPGLLGRRTAPGRSLTADPLRPDPSPERAAPTTSLSGLGVGPLIGWLALIVVGVPCARSRLA